MLALTNAVENSSVDPVTPDEIVAMLKGGGDKPHQIRALFSDASPSALYRCGAAVGVGPQAILRAYEKARRETAAANPELDLAVAEPY